MTKEIETWEGPFHRRYIPKGDFGKISKVLEEVEEAVDALEQNQHLMFLIECADILGALVGVYTKGAKDKEEEIYHFLTPTQAAPITEDSMVAMMSIKGSLQGYDETIPISVGQHVVSLLLMLVKPNSVSYEELKAFAQLRSDVARYAIKKAENNS